MLIDYSDTETSARSISLASNMESIEAGEDFISKLKDEYSLNEGCFTCIWIAMHEALSNAIVHGNKFNAIKKVTLSAETKYERYLCFTVKDEGEGFDFANVPDPTSPDLIGEPNGRGVYLINKLADIVNFSNEGRIVEMCFDMYKN